MPRFPKCTTEGCRNYLYRDGLCGPCFHYAEAAAKNERLQSIVQALADAVEEVK